MLVSLRDGPGRQSMLQGMAQHPGVHGQHNWVMGLDKSEDDDLGGVREGKCILPRCII